MPAPPDSNMTSACPAAPASRVADFYDDFATRLLRDFVYGNRRCAAAIETVCARIDGTTRRILDIGCGIGASSFEYARRFPHVRVDGIDISPRNIDTARRLFAHERCTFDVADAVAAGSRGRYDLIAMLDVYEHIPRNQWPQFNAALATCLADNATLVLTTPSPLHQAWLAENKPEGLQIVDETVEVEDVARLAGDVGGMVIELGLVDIWRTNDYMHAVISCNPRYSPIQLAGCTPLSLLGRAFARLRRLVGVDDPRSSTSERRRHVKEKLGIEI
jgi:trans-aconitate methyltransferase